MGGAAPHLRPMTTTTFLRRRVIDDPPSKLAIWSRWLALFAIAVAFLALILVRGGFIETVPGMIVFSGGIAVAVIGASLGVGALVVIWIYGSPGLGKAVFAVVAGALLSAYPLYLLVSSIGLPPLVDITTDTADVPRFETIARLRPRGANAAEHPGMLAVQQQRAAYPEIVPLDVTSSPEEVYNAALAVINKRRWRIVDARTPQAGRRDGRIEAVARTLIMGFRDDLVIRVRALRGGGARVDMRSASRYGTRDFGTNARRIRSLIAEIEEELENQPAATR
jgi:uncharacterized protein (DUF1499 family)